MLVGGQINIVVDKKVKNNLVYIVERINRLGNLGLSSPFGSRGMNARLKLVWYKSWKCQLTSG